MGDSDLGSTKTSNCGASRGPTVHDNCRSDDELSLSFDNETSSSRPQSSLVQVYDVLFEDSQLGDGRGSTQFTENGNENQEEPASQNIDASGETLAVPADVRYHLLLYPQNTISSHMFLVLSNLKWTEKVLLAPDPSIQKLKDEWSGEDDSASSTDPIHLLTERSSLHGMSVLHEQTATKQSDDLVNNSHDDSPIEALEQEVAELKTKLNEALRGMPRISGIGRDSEKKLGKKQHTNNNSNGSSKRKSPPNTELPKRQKKKVLKKNKDRIDTSNSREDGRFVRWLESSSESLRTEWLDGTTQTIEEANKKSLIEKLGRMISSVQNFGTMKKCSDKRMRIVLAESSKWDTYEELIGHLLLSNIQIKDGTRPEEYSPKYCKVCWEVGEKEPFDHDCPYCHGCSCNNWHKKPIKVEDCECRQQASADCAASAEAGVTEQERDVEGEHEESDLYCEVCGEESSGHNCPYCHLCFERGEGRVRHENCTCDQKPAAKGN